MGGEGHRRIWHNQSLDAMTLTMRPPPAYIHPPRYATFVSASGMPGVLKGSSEDLTHSAPT